MPGVHSIALAIPTGRLPRSVDATAWGSPARLGERAVAAADEDALTLAVEAGARALSESHVEPSTVRLVALATTTPPYGEKLSAAVAALALDLPEDVRSIDLTHSVRGGMDALQAAYDAVSVSGGAALVLAADCRAVEPGSVSEPNTGHAGAAVLVTGDGGLAAIDGFGSTTDELTARWRGSADRLVRDFEPRLEAYAAYRDAVPAACARALDASGVDAGDVAWIGVAAPEARAAATAQKHAGLDGARATDSLVSKIGYVGTAAPLITLAQLLESAEAGQSLVLAAAADGASAAVLRRGRLGMEGVLAGALARRTEMTSSIRALADRGLIATGVRDGLEVSPVAYWRARGAVLRRHGARCAACGALEYPAGPACSGCGAFEGRVPERLSDQGSIYTYTHDHLIDGRYSEQPVTRCVVELEGGARLYTSMSDAEAEDVVLGMPVELVLRRRGGGGFANYGWRCRPAEVR
jgi:hydroxymethylglutaryl-CoA synthase